MKNLFFDTLTATFTSKLIMAKFYKDLLFNENIIDTSIYLLYFDPTSLTTFQIRLLTSPNKQAVF